jgi:hypothetical protein
MDDSSLLATLRGPLTFLRLDRGEFDRLFGPGLEALPLPQRIFLADEQAPQLEGFPILLSAGHEALRIAADRFIRAEEQAQVAAIQRRPFKREHHTEAWQSYRRLLHRAVENATLSSYGRRYPAIFWLAHSIDVARLLRGTPRRVLQHDLEVGREQGYRIKYLVFDKFLDRARAASQETLRVLSAEGEELDEEPQPTLLRQMAENVLIFTEEHVSPDLRELTAYFEGYLGVSATDLLRRFERLAEWYGELRNQPDLQALTRHLAGVEPQAAPRTALFRHGFVRYLSSRPDYDPEQLFDPSQVELWETLLDELGRFELLSGLRRRVAAARYEGEQLVYRAGPGETGIDGRRSLVFSSSTRPLDFASSWVIDPVVHRHGMIYDVTDYSRVISQLRRTGRDAQEHGFRMLFRFQRQVDLLARRYKLNLEKFLGDGAFFTSRHPLLLLSCAVHLQRTYRAFLRQGLPFDRGLRMALNSSQYRLMPIHAGSTAAVHRYEFFGHGVVELSRLTTGKAEQSLEEVQNLLVSRGYPAETVRRFFSPLVGAHIPDRLSDSDGSTSGTLGGGEERPFPAFLARDGQLVNEGIVATADLIAQLDQVIGDRLLYGSQVHGREYVILPVDDRDRMLMVGVRKIGVAHLKGLDDLTVFEVVDGGRLSVSDLRAMRSRRLSEATEELAAAGL